LRRGVVIDGLGYMLACDGPLLRFTDVVPMFRAIYASFRVER
jgi:hypothetical protein